jgi:hypothetical protein
LKKQEIRNYFDKDNLYPSVAKKVITEDNFAEFFNIRKHFIIMTEAGKPVYTRNADENVLSSLIATFSAIIPKAQSFFVKEQREP